MPRDTQRQKSLTRRAAILGGTQVILTSALVGRLYQLQVLERDRYRVMAEENRINLRLLVPPRGKILDRFGIELADNRQNYRVVIVPEQTADIEATINAIGTLIDVGDADRRKALRDAKRQHTFIPVVVRSNLDWDEMARIEVAIPELPGVSIEQGLLRFYPFGQTAAHVIGYVAAVSEKELTGDPLLELPDFRIGKAGVEKAEDLKLRGTAGTSQVEVNAYGRVVREIARDDGQPGRDVVVALDAAMQDFAMKRVSSEQSVACVLLDAVAGDVLALVSSPSYDPMLFSNGLTPAEWQQLSTDPRNPLSDKAIGGLYPPGSTFKPVVAMAALESGAITPDTQITCPGYLELGDATFHCWRHGGHGTLRLRDAIKMSCDVFFYETARRTGIDRIAAMANWLGLGTELEIDLPTQRTGLIPTREWRIAQGHPWNLGDTIVSGIGQGYIQVTPLQLATYVARVATGRAIQPHVTRKLAGEAQPGGDPSDWPLMRIADRSMAQVREGMWAVVNEPGGTAPQARLGDPRWQLAGKTGSAQVRRVSREQRENTNFDSSKLPWEFRPHALFVCYAPYDAPRYAVSVVVEHGNAGAQMAGPIARDIMTDVLQRDPAGRTEPPAQQVAGK